MNLRRGDIFWGDFGFKCRPYVVVSCDARNATSNSAIVIPITTKQYSRMYPTHVPICYGSICSSACMAENMIKIEDPTGSTFSAVEHLPDGIMMHIDAALKKDLALN